MSNQLAREHAGVRLALEILRRLIDGDRLRAADLEADTRHGKRAAITRRLQVLARHLDPWVVREGTGKGVAQAFRWVWPAEHASTPQQVGALAAARTILETFRDGEIGGVLTQLLEDHARRMAPERLVRDD